ncbi:MMPL family transporter [Aquimonas voraii]|uniref:Predicted exporter n=1 Tax=Aquimonas voraii TaxID=265719 RepID=A0A1G7A274_9GAMM|nr:Predicted exporter [Aquimonas voraii]
MSAPGVGTRLLRVALWLGALALIAVLALGELKLSGDLRLFMPAARTAEQRLLLEQLGEGPGARLLLVALSGAEPEVLVERSRALREALEESPEFVWVGNGEDGLESIPETLVDYRYLLSAGVQPGAFEAPALSEALRQRQQDLASPAAALIAPLLRADPTLETLRVLEAWTPAIEPERRDGVWFASTRGEALLLAETASPGFDPDGQTRALAALRAAHAQVLLEDGEAAVGALEVSGPGAFAEKIAAQTRGEASRLGGFGIAGLLLLMALAYRSLALPLLGALPLATGAVFGLSATALLFGEVHGITLAFGLTLLGVAQDYPVHLFSHRRKGEPAARSARAIWPTLATGAFSSALAYLVFFFAGVDGLRQLAVLTVVGLISAVFATRYLLPRVLGEPHHAVGEGAFVHGLQRRLAQVHRLRWLALLIAALAGLALLRPGPWWQDSLAALTPVPTELLMRDRELRQALNAPDVRWLLALRADSEEAALARSAELVPGLQDLVGKGALGHFELAARYLPPPAVQRARQAALPSPGALRAALAEAQQGLAFRPEAFGNFLDAIERARHLPPLTSEALIGTPLELRIAGLLIRDGAETVALVQLSDLREVEAVRAFAAAHPDLDLIDLKATADSLAASWRAQVLLAMAVGALLLAALVFAALHAASAAQRRGTVTRSADRLGGADRADAAVDTGDEGRAVGPGGRGLRSSVSRSLRVLLPVALSSLVVLAVLHGVGVALTLFHLIALVLAAGLGLDYALFFERSAGAVDAEAAAEQRRTLHALCVCAASTLLVFGLLSLSSIPVLNALGSTVALGVAVHFALALLLAGSRSASAEIPR